jgi:predicted RNA binding protein YcfA (HicA-like mRNA interferase family)
LAKKRGGKLPTLTARDLRCVVEADGWQFVGAGEHSLNFKHPRKPGKVTISEKWASVKIGSWAWRSVVIEQAGMTRERFVDLYWEHCR